MILVNNTEIITPPRFPSASIICVNIRGFFLPYFGPTKHNWHILGSWNRPTWLKNVTYVVMSFGHPCDENIYNIQGPHSWPKKHVMWCLNMQAFMVRFWVGTWYILWYTHVLRGKFIWRILCRGPWLEGLGFLAIIYIHPLWMKGSSINKSTLDWGPIHSNCFPLD